MHIATAAVFCDAQFTAILYGDLDIYSKDNRMSDDTKAIQRKSYQSIGELDAVTPLLDPIKSRSEYLRFNQNFMDSFLRFDVQPTLSQSHIDHWEQAGLYSAVNRFAHASDTIAPNYECAWRLGDWSIVDGADERPTQDIRSMCRFDKHHYFALKCLKRSDEMGVQSHLRHATEEIVKVFRQSSSEVANNIYNSLMQLNMLQQIDEFASAQFSNQEPLFKSMLDKWKGQDSIQSNDFKYREPIQAQRIALVEVAGTRAKRKIDHILMSDGKQRLIMDLIGECRMECFYNLCTRYLSMLEQLELTEEMNVHIQPIVIPFSIGHAIVDKLTNYNIILLVWIVDEHVDRGCSTELVQR